MPRNPYQDYIKAKKKKASKRPSASDEMLRWRKKWRELGPVRFAEEILTCPYDVPPHPDYGTRPPFVMLEEFQKDFLEDMWKRNATQIILAAGRGCLEENSPIQMADGTFKPIKDVQAGEYILSFNYKTKNIDKVKVIDNIYNGIKDVYKVKSVKGNELLVTDDHKFLQKYYNNERWLQAKEFITRKDRTAKYKSMVINSYDVSDYDISDEKIILLASLISEGSYGFGQSPKITNKDNDYLEQLEEIVINEFGMSPKWYKKSRGYDLLLTDSNKNQSNIIDWLKRIGMYGQTKENKRVPEFVFRFSNRQIKLFLRWFFIGDGNLYIHKRKNVSSYQTTLYPGPSLGLAKDLKLLLTRLGIYSKINMTKANDYEVRFYTKEKYDRLFNDNNLESLSYNNEYTRIKEYIGKRPVYDLELESGYNSFVSNGFVVHNCGKTFCIAIYVTWRIACFDHFTMTVMGGSQEQSNKIKQYVDDWRLEVEEIDYAIYKSRAGGNTAAQVDNRWGSYARFPACYTPDTEILTKKGMKYFPELTYEDEIATLNPDTHEIEYYKPHNIISFEYEGDMFSWAGKSYNLICTLDQNLYVKRNRRKNNKFELVEAETILNTPHEKSGATKYHLKRNCNWKGEYLTDEMVSNEIGFKITTEDYLELMGWYLSEGWYDSVESHTNKNRVGICQSDSSPEKRQNQARIERLLKNLNINHSFNNKQGFVFRHKKLHQYFSQFGKSYEKYIPDIILNSSKRDMNIFLKTFIFGDGTYRNGKIETIITSSKKMKDDFIELLLKCGYGVTCKTRTGGEYEGYECKENYVLQISHKQLEPRSWNPPERIYMKTVVWDVTVPNHIIYVGREGKYSWQGNCSETAARGPHVTQLMIDEVCLHPDSILFTEYGVVEKSLNLNVGDLLLSHDGKYHNITEKFEREINEEILEIKPYYFPIGIKVTKNHPFYGDKRRGNPYYYEKEDRYTPPPVNIDDILLHWINADELKVNDFVSFPIPKRNIKDIDVIDLSSYLKKTSWNNILKVEVTEDFCELLGWYIAKGSTNNDRIFFSLNEGEEHHVANLIRKVFNKEPQFHYFKSNNCVNVFFSSRSMVRWLKEVCGNGAPNKHIPYVFMGLPKNKINKIIKGIKGGDVYEDKDKFRLHISSLNLGMQLVYLRAEDGKFTSIQETRTGYEFTGYNYNKYGFIKDGYMIIPIREINKLHYKGKVYNFSVEETETYCSPFITLHNCVGESKGRGGAKAVRSARGQLTSSSQSLLVYTSTAHFVFGTFFKTWRNYKRMRWKRYRWSTGRYYKDKEWFLTTKEGEYILDEHGRKQVHWDYVDTVLIKDRNPEHWISNVWWITTEDIQNLRANASNDEFLVEVLGGISKGAGLVFSREDLQRVICTGEDFTADGNPCMECNPYTDSCPMMKKTGMTLGMISNRKLGVDFGEVAPTAVTVTGMRGRICFVLYSDERTGQRTDEILDWIDKEIGKKYGIWEIFADPEERALREALGYRDYSTPHLWQMGGGAKKEFFVTNLKRLIEQHRMFIPSDFTYLIESISELAYNEKGKIRKHNDHSFDSLLYATSDYGVDAGSDEFWKLGNRQINLWE